ncbi:MAG: hypothetical protein COC01_00205 [Bacteroidetes bacterium]|nr:MAG: hypothetical protein COC01_00205 [Bacteroidota bacterium]
MVESKAQSKLNLNPKYFGIKHNCKYQGVSIFSILLRIDHEPLLELGISEEPYFIFAYDFEMGVLADYQYQGKPEMLDLLQNIHVAMTSEGLFFEAYLMTLDGDDSEILLEFGTNRERNKLKPPKSLGKDILNCRFLEFLSLSVLEYIRKDAKGLAKGLLN